MTDPGIVDRVWYGAGTGASFGRALLTPAARLFGAIVGARELLYDAGVLVAHETAIPALSVGNLTVGGTGKTPIAAWIARGLADRGARPAVVLRGYGDDEPLVHRALNPDIPVVLGRDRREAIEHAARDGADIAVLDDAFQHRQVRRFADLVLVNADRWTPRVRLLPAGPWRERLEAIRRATLIIVTRKAANDTLVESVHTALAHIAATVPRVSVRLEQTELRRVGADESPERLPIDTVAGASIRAILSIADPGAFVRQLEARGAHVRASVFPDHHAFTADEVARLAADGDAGTLVVCTLKDAVKLAQHWPRLAPPLWYVSQQVMVERGVGGLERVLDDAVRARSRTAPTAG